MINYSDKQLETIYKDNSFNNILKGKEKNIKELVNFLNSIKLNQKYYRLTTNKNNGKYKKLISSDTVFLKDLNSILNKLTDTNLDKLVLKIKDRISDKQHLKLMIIQTILEKSSVHMSYISVYIDLLIKLYSDIDECIIQKILDNMYKTINNKNIDNEQSEYLQFCDKNKKIDLIISHTYLVCECEKRNLIKNKIDILVNELINEYTLSEVEDDRFRSIKCVYTIFGSIYKNKEIPEKYVNKLKECMKKEGTIKIKFKIMDILEKK